MGAPKGNQFWKLRSKHGRDKLFATPELMWEAACEYFEWVDANPLTKPDYVGKDGIEVTRALGRPYTLHGLCLYLDCSTQFFGQFKAGLNKEKEIDKDFYIVVTRIEQTVYSQKFEGASVGIFNHNIIARDLGLADKQENKIDGTMQITGMNIL